MLRSEIEVEQCGIGRCLPLQYSWNEEDMLLFDDEEINALHIFFGTHLVGIEMHCLSQRDFLYLLQKRVSHKPALHDVTKSTFQVGVPLVFLPRHLKKPNKASVLRSVGYEQQTQHADSWNLVS